MPTSELLAARRVAPSILSADFARLGAQVEEVMAAGARVIHVDVMDGHFVPPITIGPTIVEALAGPVKDAGGILDVHLMIERPERQVEEFAKAGADNVTIHLEATPNVHYTLMATREAGCSAGLVINPGTAPDAVSPLLGAFDLLLCMTVNPGWGGQSFIDGSLERIGRLRELIGPDAPLEIDGGVGVETAGPCADAGANLLVAGSAIFKADDPGAAYGEIAAAAGAS